MGRRSPIHSSQGFTYGKQAGRTDGDTLSGYTNHKDPVTPNTAMADQLRDALGKSSSTVPDPKASK